MWDESEYEERCNCDYSTKLKMPFLYVYFVTMSIENERGRKNLAIDGLLYVLDEYSSDGCTARLRI